MKLESIEIRGMHKIGAGGKTYHFNSSNYLIGPNGAGKSTVLQAVQLALLGYIPGTDKKPGAIFAHGCEPTMSVTATISNGPETIIINRVWKSTGTTVNGTCTISPNTYVEQNIPGWLGGLELPVFDFGQFMGLTANKLKDWFIGFLPKSETSADWEKVLKDPNQITATYTENIKNKLWNYATTHKLLGIDGVIRMNEYIKTLQAANKADIARLTSTIQEMVFYSDVTETRSVTELTALLDAARQESTRINNLIIQLQRREQIENQIKSLGSRDFKVFISDDPDYILAVKTRDSAEKSIKAADEKRSNLKTARGVLTGQIMTLHKIINSGGVCPFTDEACETIGSKVEKYKQDVIDLQLQVVENDAEQKTVNDKITKMTRRRDAAKRSITTLEQQRSNYNLLSQQLTAIGEVNVDADVLGEQSVANAATVKDLTDLLIKVRANEQYNLLADNLKSQKAVAECEETYLKYMLKETSANGLQSRLSQETFEAFINKMNPTISAIFEGSGIPNIRAQFNLVEKANSFSVGLMRGDLFTPYDLLSSGEKCLFTFALVSTLIQVSNAKLPVFLLDDLIDHLDDDNAESFFNGISRVDNVQLMLAGVQKYTGKQDGVVIDVRK